MHSAEVRAVLHPGWGSFPGYALGKSQMSGYSGLFGFRLQPCDRAAQHRCVGTTLKRFRLGYRWGGYDGIILPLINPFRNSPTLGRELGLDDDPYRIGIGLKDPEDMIAILAEGLQTWAQG